MVGSQLPGRAAQALAIVAALIVGTTDVTAGNNDVVAGTGGQCGGDYLCVAVKGYDALTGLGTPHGTAVFWRGPGASFG
jgi:hypothetical protein